MNSLNEFARDKLAGLERRALRRSLTETWRRPHAGAEHAGRTMVSFSCNDYLNLSQHPTVKRAAADAIDRYGLGAGASRLVTGNHPPLVALEKRLARYKGTDAALVFGSGYLANLGIVPALVGVPDVVFIDELAHACLHGGSRLSGAAVRVFRHNDIDDLRAQLNASRADHRHCLVLTDTVFSMDGDLAPLDDLADVAAAYDAWLMTDDAHGLGVVPATKNNAAPLQMGTLSKAIGGYGGYLCAAQPVIDLLVARARTLVYSTGLPPAVAAAAYAALDIIESDPKFCARPVAKAAIFCEIVGLPAPQSPIVPVIVGDAEPALTASSLLAAHGFLVTAIRPPTVPDGTARLRVTFSADHRDDDVVRLATLIRDHVL